jgi:hypothetical protein
MNSFGKFISTNIATFTCSGEYKRYTENFMAPANAVVAIVYASSHTKNLVRFKEIELYK